MALSKTAKKHLLYTAFFVLLGLPVIILIGLLIRYSINVPFWDQWELVTLIQKSTHGALSFADFFAQHNEHRIFFPRLIMYGLARATHWDTRYEVACNVLLAVVAFLFVLKMLKKTFPRQDLFMPLAILLSFIFFSPLQWENWMWGWQIQWFLNILGVIVAVWALHTWETTPLKKFILAAIMGIVATYSLASGMFIWVVCIPIFWTNKSLKKYLVPWLLVGILSVAVHYIGYVNPAYHPSKLLFIHEPIQFIKYFVIYMTRPIIFSYVLGIITALAFLTGTLAMLAYIYFKQKAIIWTVMLPWLCLASYSLMASISTDMARLGFGSRQAYSNRYVTISNLFLVFVCVLILKTYEVCNSEDSPHNWIQYVAISCTVAISIFVGINFQKGIHQMQEQSQHLSEVRKCATTSQSQNDPCLLLLYPNQPVVWARLQFLRSIHWGGL